MYIDLHAHLDVSPLYSRIDEVLAHAEKAGLAVIVTSGIHPSSNRITLELCRRYSLVKASLGLYPIDALQREIGSDYTVNVDEEIAFIRGNSERIIAIGEIGLDYKTGHDQVAQQELFHRLLGLANELHKPVIIHSRSAEADALRILSEYPDLRVILHCFSGKKQLVQVARDRGYSFTIPAHVGRVFQFQEMVKLVPLNQLFCETDAPWLSPFKGTENEPAFVIESYKKIAEIRGMTTEEVARIIYHNWQRVFV